MDIRRSLEGNRVVKRMRIHRPATGDVREVTESVRLYDPGELAGFATQVDLRLRCAFGDYAGAEYSAASERWIGVFEKRQ